MKEKISPYNSSFESIMFRCLILIINSGNVQEESWNIFSFKVITRVHAHPAHLSKWNWKIIDAFPWVPPSTRVRTAFEIRYRLDSKRHKEIVVVTSHDAFQKTTVRELKEKICKDINRELGKCFLSHTKYPSSSCLKCCNENESEMKVILFIFTFSQCHKCKGVCSCLSRQI